MIILIFDAKHMAEIYAPDMCAAGVAARAQNGEFGFFMAFKLLFPVRGGSMPPRTPLWVLFE